MFHIDIPDMNSLAMDSLAMDSPSKASSAKEDEDSRDMLSLAMNSLVMEERPAKDKDCSMGKDCSMDSCKLVPVKQHYRKLPGGGSTKKGASAKKKNVKKSVPVKRKTNIKERKEMAKLSKGSKMDPATFRAIVVQMNRDKENFPVEQRNQERNERNALLWNNFRNSVQRQPKRRKIKTREQVKKDKAVEFEARYIDALNNLNKPLPMEFMQL